jgi:hypothetical protein
VSDFLSPETPDDMRPEDPHGDSSVVAPDPPASSGGAYPVYICIPKPSVDTPLTFKQGSVGQQLIMMLLHANDTPMDLTGKLVRLKMRSVVGGALKVDSLVVVLLASMGIISYSFVGTDTDTPGSYNVEFVATNTDGSAGSETYPADTYLRVRIIASEG